MLLISVDSNDAVSVEAPAVAAYARRWASFAPFCRRRASCAPLVRADRPIMLGEGVVVCSLDRSWPNLSQTGATFVIQGFARCSGDCGLHTLAGDWVGV